MEDQFLPQTVPNHPQNDVAESDDDSPALSLQALEALKEFLSEQQTEVPPPSSAAPPLISEDWRMSQFWYDHNTAQTLADEVLSLRESSSSTIACVACPSLYAYLKNIDSDAIVQLLEYDPRFERYGSDFTFYDYNQPLDLPLELKHRFDIVVTDPPYLSHECLEKVVKTVEFLARPEKSDVLLLTGRRCLFYFPYVTFNNVTTNNIMMDFSGDRIRKRGRVKWLLNDELRAAELMGLRPCGFRPLHSSKLGNEFRLFLSYDPETRLGGLDD